MDTLDTFAPEPRRIPILRGTRTVEVRPLTLRQLPGFTRAIAPAMGAILMQQWLQALTVYQDAVIDGLAIATGEDRETLLDLLPDEFVALAGAVREANEDFLTRVLIPAARPWKATIEAGLRSDGPPPSLGSAAGGTASTPSSA